VVVKGFSYKTVESVGPNTNVMQQKKEEIEQQEKEEVPLVDNPRALLNI
jgi:hypothetical protein